MKKLYSILLGGALTLICAGTAYADAKTVPYSSPIAVSSDAFDDGWTVVDANGDGMTWQPKSKSATSIGGTSYSAEAYGLNTGTDKDDWLISPAISLDADKQYRVFFGVMAEGSTHPQDMNVYATTSNQPDVIKTSDPIKKYEGYTKTTYVKEDIKFTPSASGDYYFSFHCTSVNDNWYMYVAVLEVYEDTFTPAAVTNFKAERNGDTPRKVECTLSWTLPTKSVFDEDFTEAQTVEQVNIYRDGAARAIATLTAGKDEDLTTFVDDDTNGLEAGIHTYEVEVVVAGVTSAKVSATTKYVGPVTPATVPFTWNITSADDFEDWTSLVGESAVNKTNWTYYSIGQYARFSNTAGSKEENYIVAPPFKIDDEGYYLVTVNAMIGSTSYNEDNTLQLRYGTEPNTESLSHIICDKINLTSGSKAPYSYVVKITNPGVYYFAAVAASESPKSTTFGVYSIGLEKTEKTPAAVTELTATPGDEDALTVTLKWTCPATSSNGEELLDSEYNIEVYKGSELLETLSGGTSTYTDNVDEPGVYTYTVKTVAPQGASVDGVTVKSKWVGPHVVSLPYSTNFAPADETVAIWDVIDANGDGKTWHYYDNSYRCTQSDDEGSESGTRKYNDYFLSPHFEMTPGYYTIKFRPVGGNATKPMTHKVGIIEAGTFKAATTELQQEKQYQSASTNSKTAPLVEYIIKIETAGRYQIVFAATEDQPTITSSDLDYSGYGFNNFEAAEYPVLPDVVTDLTVTPAENQVLEATISWTNPTTTNVDGVDLTEITKAVIYRDGEQVTEVFDNLIPGETSTFTDTEEYGLTGGKHTYKVEVYNNSGKSTAAAPEVISEWIGGGLEAPVVFEVSGNVNTKFEDWTFIDVDNNKNGNYDICDAWSIAGTTALKVDETNSNDKYDDWAISQPVNIKSWMLYELTFKTYLNTYKSYGSYSFDVYMGSGSNTGEFVKVGTVTSDVQNANYSTPETHTLYIAGLDASETVKTMAVTLPEDEVDTVDRVVVPAGSLSIALHANTKGGVYVKSVSIEEVGQTSVDEVVADKDGKLFFDGNALSFNGTATDVRVFDLTGKLVAAVAAAEGSVDLSDLENGLYIVTMNLNGETVTVKVVK